MKVAVDLPFSRKLELEADSIGLRLMAKACYDPRASIQMNSSLGQLQKNNSVAQSKYFSTHPPSAERIKALRYVDIDREADSFLLAAMIATTTDELGV